MRLLKWLFQPTYILLIIVLVALYVNREAIFPEEVAESLEAEALIAKAEDVIEQLRNGVAQSIAEAPQTEATSTSVAPQGLVSERDTADDAGASPAETVAEDKPTTVAVAEDHVTVATPVEENVVAESSAEAAMATTDTQSPLAVAPGVPQTSSDEALEEGAETEPLLPIVPPAPVVPVASAPAQALELWQAARAAVWQGDLDGASRHYHELIALQPQNFDAYGELGNVLLAQNNVPAAIEAYASAARLIRDTGNIEMAYRVVSIVATLDEGRANALNNEFSQ